ncbi:MAG: SHOCT domain-containing protein [Terrisporobacter sp.]
MVVGTLIILFGIYKLVKGGSTLLSLGIIGFGILFIYSYFRVQKDKEASNTDRSTIILDEIQGADNIDINLSKYSEESQLIVLKNKTICIGHDNFEIKKFINFDSIMKLEVKINNATIGSYRESSNNIVREIIDSITVYIHTQELTEELVFKLDTHDAKETQEKYREIEKGLKRFQVILGDNGDVENTNSTDTKSIPEQIKEYKELLDINAITEEEFETKKKELLKN